jgi:hypothetical protein
MGDGVDARQVRGRLSRREVLAGMGAVGAAGSSVGLLGATGSSLGLLGSAVRPAARVAAQAPSKLPDIQFDIGDFLPPVETVEGVRFRFGPVFTKFVTATLTRAPTRQDQAVLADALDTIEGTYRFAPDGVFTFVAYGIPYFRRLPRPLVAASVPRLAESPARFVLEEAVPAPTDVSLRNPDIMKRRFNTPVRIERNDLLFSIRSDSLRIASDVEAWLAGSNVLADRAVLSPKFAGLIRFSAARVMFTQRGMPRRLADAAHLRFAQRIHPQSPMWMGFADQHVDGSGPAAITTFQGNASARLTSARPGDYFANGSIQHLSHVILDLDQFYFSDVEDGDDNDETFLERVQYMFRSTPPPARGFADQTTDGGGPAFLPNEFRGSDDAARAAQGIGTPNRGHRIGHLSALQRSSRAPDGTAIHIRMDGPGFDSLDVTDGSAQPKLQFSIFVPTAEFFARMRRNQAAVDLANAHKVPEDDQGLERFLTTTRRQNFLVPPRLHRAFPLVEELRPPS